MGTVGSAFVLTWPIGREVNPPHLAGVAVAVVNLGGFLGTALTQAPIGALLDARWTVPWPTARACTLWTHTWPPLGPARRSRSPPRS